MNDKQINLLPKSRQVQLRYRNWYLETLRVYFFAGLTFVLLSVSLLGVHFYVKVSRNALEREAESLREIASSQENAEIKGQIKQVNSRISDYNALAGSLPRWSAFLEKFADTVPEGLQIQSLSVESATRKVQIRGFAPTRELVIALHDLIQAESDSFEDIDYPLENVARPEDVAFHYTFIIKEGVLK